MTSPDPAHRQTSTFYAQATTLGYRQVRVVVSTAQVDRTGDVVVQSGIDLSKFMMSRSVLWQHDPLTPVAQCLQIGIQDGRMVALVQFPPDGVSTKADEVYGLIKAGVINAASIGFLPIDVEPADGKNPRKGLRIDTSELLEFSFVSVPANPGAQILERSIPSHRSAEIEAARKGRTARIALLNCPVDRAREKRTATLASLMPETSHPALSPADRAKLKRSVSLMMLGGPAVDQDLLLKLAPAHRRRIMALSIFSLEASS